MNLNKINKKIQGMSMLDVAIISLVNAIFVIILSSMPPLQYILLIIVGGVGFNSWWPKFFSSKE